MKSYLLLCCSLLLAGSAFGGELFRTDINPALRYFQAFTLAPDLSEEDHQYLFVEEWRGRPLDARFGELISKYDNTFKLFRHARFAQVPCDWGVDLSEGPHALLPGLARAKNAAQTARLRVLWHLQNGRPDDARDDLLATYALGRNTSKDHILISALVQFAIEHIIVSIVAENFYRFPPQTLEQIVQGIEAAPARGTVAGCVPTERAGFYDWALRKFEAARQAYPNQKEKRFAEMLATLLPLQDNESDNTKLSEQLNRVTGGDPERLLALVHELEPLFVRVAAIGSLPYLDFKASIRAFEEEVSASPNPLVPTFFSVYEKCGVKQFAVDVDVTMLKAAVAHKVHGSDAFKKIKDPCGSGPFGFRRFVFNGVDRGFELRSSLTGRGFDEVMLFVEKEGPPFQIMGPNAGKAVQTSPTNK